MNQERQTENGLGRMKKLFIDRHLGDEKIQQALDYCSRKKPIFLEKMAKRLEEEGGYIRSCNQIREKIKQLKQKYKEIKGYQSVFWEKLY